MQRYLRVLVICSLFLAGCANISYYQRKMEQRIKAKEISPLASVESLIIFPVKDTTGLFNKRDEFYALLSDTFATTFPELAVVHPKAIAKYLDESGQGLGSFADYYAVAKRFGVDAFIVCYVTDYKPFPERERRIALDVSMCLTKDGTLMQHFSRIYTPLEKAVADDMRFFAKDRLELEKTTLDWEKVYIKETLFWEFIIDDIIQKAF